MTDVGLVNYTGQIFLKTVALVQDVRKNYASLVYGIAS